MDGSSRTINPACVRSRRAQASKGLGKNVHSSSRPTTRLLSENLARIAMNGQLEKPMQKYKLMLVEAYGKPHDIVIYTDGSVTRDRSGWGFTVKQGGRTVHEDSGAHRVTTSSLTMEVEAVTHTIQWRASQRDAQITHAIILTNSKNLLQKVDSGMGCPDWHTAMHSLWLQRLLWHYCSGYAGVSGNERADRLASTSGLQLGWAEVLKRLEELSEHGQARASQHCSPEGKRSGERKRPTFDPLRSRTICIQPGKYWHCFESNVGEAAERRGGARMGLSERYDAILS